MASKFDDSDFIDGDLRETAIAEPGMRQGPEGIQGRPPTREELDQRVSDAQKRLADLKRAQEELERERAALEEGRRRRIELKVGRDEMLQHLTRGVALLEEREMQARRDAEQMSKTLTDLRDVQGKVQGIREEDWTQENWQGELTRALTAVENARMEWNGARLKWPFLDGVLGVRKAETEENEKQPGLLEEGGFWKQCKLGAALMWPVALTVLIGFGAVVFALLYR